MIQIILAVLQIILAVGISGFWIFFFMVENKNPEKEDWYLRHERSFPLPDLGLITICLLVSATGLLTGERFGIFFTIVSGGGLMFLGLIDLAFNLQNGLFKTKNLDAYMSIGIVSIVLIMGVLCLVYGYFNF
jgi:hypothetical protein